MIYNKFYTISDDGEPEIHHDGLVNFLKDDLCIRVLKGGKSDQYIRLHDKIIEPLSGRNRIIWMVREYMCTVLPENLGNGCKRNILINKFVRGIEKYFSSKKFALIDEMEVPNHKDEQDSGTFYYKNCFVKITANGITVHDYEELDWFIWESQILPRDFTSQVLPPLEFEFDRFLFNVSAQDNVRYTSLKSHLGYLLHNHKNKSRCFSVVFMDEKRSLDGEANGGSGKSIVADALRRMIPTVTVDGRNFTIKSRFSFQRVTRRTQMMLFDDASPFLPFESLFNILTDGITVEEKYQKAYHVTFRETFKVLITTNYVLMGSEGPSMSRRRSELEFAAYYTLEKTPFHEFGHNFFEDWNSEQWLKFDNLMLDCLVFYLKNGVIEYPVINRHEKKLEATVTGELLEFVKEYLRGKSGEVKFNKKSMYPRFMRAYSGSTVKTRFATQKSFSLKVRKILEFQKYVFRDWPSDNKTDFLIEIPEPGTKAMNEGLPEGGAATNNDKEMSNENN